MRLLELKTLKMNDNYPLIISLNGKVEMGKDKDINLVDRDEIGCSFSTISQVMVYPSSNKKFEQESPDFSQERNALFVLYQLLGILVPDVLFYNLFAHVSQSTHVVTVAP